MTHREIITKAFSWWIAAGCKTYGLKHAEITAKIPVYVEMLKHLDETALEAACRACGYREDFPSVADVVNAVEKLREEQRALPEAKGKSKGQPDCALCDSTGWEEVSCGTYTAVKECRCTKGLDFPRAQERKQIGAGEFRELIAEAAKGRVM